MCFWFSADYFVFKCPTNGASWLPWVKHLVGVNQSACNLNHLSVGILLINKSDSSNSHLSSLGWAFPLLSSWHSAWGADFRGGVSVLCSPGSSSVVGTVSGGRSRLHLIDLGSCEKVLSKSRDGGGGLCLSLNALGNVIMALANGAKHVPYR